MRAPGASGQIQREILVGITAFVDCITDRRWLLATALQQGCSAGSERFAGVAGDHRHLIKYVRTEDSDGAGVLMNAHALKEALA